MKQTRTGVFETNSSSTHSITIDKHQDIWAYPKSPLTACFGEFGWENKHYSGVENKLSYVFTMMQYRCGTTKQSGILNSKWVKWLHEMVFDYCGQTINLEINDSTYYPLGYIDHQSTDMLDDIWADDESKFKNNMKEFIFNTKYGFSTGNDNE